MDLVQWLVDIQQAWAFATSARVQLDYLAYQYRAFGCFHQYMDHPLDGPGLPSGPFTNSAGVNCERMGA